MVDVPVVEVDVFCTWVELVVLLDMVELNVKVVVLAVWLEVLVRLSEVVVLVELVEDMVFVEDVLLMDELVELENVDVVTVEVLKVCVVEDWTSDGSAKTSSAASSKRSAKVCQG